MDKKQEIDEYLAFIPYQREEYEAWRSVTDEMKRLASVTLMLAAKTSACMTRLQLGLSV